MHALWLIGMMGSGKTAVGSVVAERSGSPLFDTDTMIQTVRTAAITSIWDDEGEKAFRDLEERQIEEIVAAGKSCVVATGGGVVLRQKNVVAMRSNGLVVWLTATAEELAARVADDGTRPLLRGRPVHRRLDDLLARRARAYAAAAHHRIDTSGRSVEEIADEVLALWKPS